MSEVISIGDARLVPDFPDYCVNSSGEVFTKRPCTNFAGNPGWRRLKGQENKRRGRKKQYLYVNVYRERGRMEKFYIHQLVLLAFVGPCPEGMEVRHLDDNTLNNALSNLCYGTHLQNQQDAVQNRCYRYGENHQNARFTADEIRDIRQMAAAGIKYRVITEKYGINHSHISRIVKREIYASVT